MKEKNIKKLDDWYASIGSPKLIRLKEAKSLYQKMVQSKLKEEQKSLFDELRLGTISLVYTNIRNSFLPYIAYNEYDIEDILYAGIEIWTNWLKSGKLLEMDAYSLLFKHHRFFWSLKACFVPETFFVYDFWNITEKDIGTLFYKYFTEKQDITSSLPSTILPLFETMSSILNTEIHLWEQEENIPERQIKIIMPYLIQKALNKTYNEDPNFLKTLVARDFILDVENKVLKENFLQILSSLKLAKKRKYILSEYYGSNLSFEKIAQTCDCSKENISQINQNVLKKLRKTNEIKNIKLEDYDLTPCDYPFLSLKKR